MLQAVEPDTAHKQVHQGSGSLQKTAQMTTELAQTSEELKHYLVLNSQLLEKYSHELLHVQSLAAQLVQMQSMQL